MIHVEMNESPHQVFICTLLEKGEGAVKIGNAIKMIKYYTNSKVLVELK